ncbi:MAG: hypothetical protein AAGD05_06565, partial [Bacteroidota bacterium]
TGRYDAHRGLLLTGDCELHFTPQSHRESGILLDGDAKALVQIAFGEQGVPLLLVGQNNDQLKAFQLNSSIGSATQLVSIQDLPRDPANDQMANGRRKIERYYGSGYLSQSSQKKLPDLPAQE